jgi:hypothetical protein
MLKRFDGACVQSIASLRDPQLSTSFNGDFGGARIRIKGGRNIERCQDREHQPHP